MNCPPKKVAVVERWLLVEVQLYFRPWVIHCHNRTSIITQSTYLPTLSRFSLLILIRNSVCSADEMTVFKLSHSFIHSFCKAKKKKKETQVSGQLYFRQPFKLTISSNFYATEGFELVFFLVS